MKAAAARDLAVWVLLVPVLIWPAIYNGQAIYFYDTLSYVSGANVGIMALLHHRTHWSSPHPASASASSMPSSPSPAVTADPAWDKIVTTGRSWFYGALLYVGDLLGGFWLTIVLQAAAALAALALTLGALRLPRMYILPVAIGLALLSSLPFYVSFLMPDIFTGIAIAGSAVLLTGAVELSRWQLATWWVLLSAAALFHDTNLPILCTVLVGAGVMRGLTGTGANRSGMIAILLAIVIGVLGQVAFAFAIKRANGVPPVRPPFLTARVIEDGTGIRYLRATCPGNGFQVCRFIDRLPMPADDLLWDMRPGSTLWATASAEDKRRLSAEQIRLAGAVFAFDPIGQLSASVRNAAHQLVSTGLWEFFYPDEEKKSLDRRLPEDLLPRLHASAAYQRTMPIATFEAILTATFYGSICFIGAMLLWRKTRRALQPAIISASLWMLIGVVVNAVVCGVISGPHERYSTRVQWLLPLTAMLILAGLLTHRARAASPPIGQSPQPAAH